MPFRRLPETVSTLYAELLDQLQAAERSSAPGSFVSKRLGNATYWYAQHVVAGRKKQVYLGRESDELLARIADAREAKADLRADDARRGQLVSMLAAGGVTRESAAVSAVLRALAEARVFESGGVLVGTQAFACYANMLGVHFDLQTLRTADIDVGHDPAVALSAERVDVREVSTSFKVRGRDLRVDFLAPAHSRAQTKPVELRQLGVAAQPMQGLGYLIERFEPAAVVGGNGILVNVPLPARFALHKLWVSQQRPVSEQAKVRKDLRQGEQLIEVLLEDRPQDLRAAARALRKHPSTVRKIAAAARKVSPEIGRQIVGLLPS